MATTNHGQNSISQHTIYYLKRDSSKPDSRALSGRRIDSDREIHEAGSFRRHSARTRTAEFLPRIGPDTPRYQSGSCRCRNWLNDIHRPTASREPDDTFSISQSSRPIRQHCPTRRTKSHYRTTRMKIVCYRTTQITSSPAIPPTPELSYDPWIGRTDRDSANPMTR